MTTERITRGFNDIGEKITIQLTYQDREISKLPQSCRNCPVGYMHGNCGREYPLGDKRPDTCMLEVVDIERALYVLKEVKQYIAELDAEIDRCHKLAEQNIQDESNILAEMMVARVQALGEVKNDLQSRLEESV